MAEFFDIGGDAFFLVKSRAVVHFSDDTHNPRKDKITTWNWARQDNRDRTAWVPWYSPSNDFPRECLNLVTNNNILFGILGTKVEFLLGQGIVTYTETIDLEGKRVRKLAEEPKFEQWLLKNNLLDLLTRRATDREYFGCEYMEMVFTEGGEVDTIRHIDALTVRSGWKNKRTGKVDSYFLCSDWSKPVYDPAAKGKARKENNVRRVPAFDPENPTKYEKCIICTKSYMPGHPYYPLPAWWATSEWIRLASKIPRWHRKGMDNGYNIRYHVEIPSRWLEMFPPDQREAKKEEIRSNMDNFLSGADNAGKTFFSTYSNNGGLPDGWKITPIDTNLNDAAYTEIFSQSNTAVVSGLGIDPTLAGVVTEGGLGNASEKRIAYGIHMALKTPRPRKELLEFLKIVQQLNGWNPQLKFGFRDIELTTLDAAPTGERQVTN